MLGNVNHFKNGQSAQLTQFQNKLEKLQPSMRINLKMHCINFLITNIWIQNLLENGDCFNVLNGFYSLMKRNIDRKNINTKQLIL